MRADNGCKSAVCAEGRYAAVGNNQKLQTPGPGQGRVWREASPQYFGSKRGHSPKHGRGARARGPRHSPPCSPPPCSGECGGGPGAGPPEGRVPSWERTCDPDLLALAVEPARSTAWAGGQRLLCAQPWPSVTLSRACLLGLPPCPRASWARTCLRSTSFAGNSWARPRLPAAPARLCSDLPSAPTGPGYRPDPGGGGGRSSL